VSFKAIGGLATREVSTMLNKIFGLVITAVIMLGLLGLSACNNDSLDDYKAEGKLIIEDYAQDIKENYSDVNWTKICDIVTVCKTAIDAAESKTDVDNAVAAARGEINKEVLKLEYEGEEPILFMSGAEEFAEGDGTEENPYIINNRGQLIYFSNQINDGININANYALAADIDLKGMEWTPIGIFRHYYGNDVFSGVFDGKGYEISNFCITVRNKNTSAENIGLFGRNKGTIKYLGVVDVDIDVVWSYQFGYKLSISAGGLAGSNIGSITNCYSIGSINLEYYGGATITAPAHIYAGGLAGYSEGNLTNCYSTIDVNAVYHNEVGTVYAAGLAVGGAVQNCFVTGNVNAEYYYHTLGGESRVFSISGEDLVNCYTYEGQIVNSLTVKSFIPEGLITADELNTAEFYVNQLGWSAEVWNLEDLSFIDGKFVDNRYPMLK